MELRDMLDFLKLNASEDLLNCVLRNSEGSFRRKPSELHMNPFDMIGQDVKDLLDVFAAAIESTVVMVTDRENWENKTSATKNCRGLRDTGKESAHAEKVSFCSWERE